jgi:hypothetical protein
VVEGQCGVIYWNQEKEGAIIFFLVFFDLVAMYASVSISPRSVPSAWHPAVGGRGRPTETRLVSLYFEARAALHLIDLIASFSISLLSAIFLPCIIIR